MTRKRLVYNEDMKIDFPLPQDDKTHKYCIECHADGVQEVMRDDMRLFGCPSCGKVSERYIHIGNGPDDGKWWLDDKEEIWHESAGVFVRNPEGKYLFFERTSFPLGLTIPAGHVSHGEEHGEAVTRELEEEVGIKAEHIRHLLDVDIEESCIGGADSHRWHVYGEDLDAPLEVEVREEGRKPVWLTLEEAASKELPAAARYLIENHAAEIEAKAA
jgi:8-oxo-dGTP pyrophosphatase MutT (NUDIX family)